MRYYVYILKSERDGGVYVSHTDDMALEMARHEAGEIRDTKYRLPVQLIHKEPAKSFKQVKMRKRYWSGREGQKEIESWVGKLQRHFEKDKRRKR